VGDKAIFVEDVRLPRFARNGHNTTKCVLFWFIEEVPIEVAVKLFLGQSTMSPVMSFFSRGMLIIEPF
jgi:hypothetical protein